MTGVIGILLAAGQARRFGGDKCLTPLSDGRAMILHAAEGLLPAVDEMICVIRADDPALREVCEANGMSVMECPDASQGMSASLKSGIMAYHDAQGWLLALGDMPLIKAATCQQVAAALREEEKIIVPTFQGKRGHPVAFPRRYRKALLALKGDRGASAVIQQYAHEVRELPVEDFGIAWDVDTKEALLLADSLHVAGGKSRS